MKSQAVIWEKILPVHTSEKSLRRIYKELL